jgi:hypothetical protein
MGRTEAAVGLVMGSLPGVRGKTILVEVLDSLAQAVLLPRLHEFRLHPEHG